VELIGWKRHFFYRKESLRTTWKLRLSILVLTVLVVWLTRGFWTMKIGQSLVCSDQIANSDALLLENFDLDYLVFERAAALQRAGVAPRIFVPVLKSNDPEIPVAVHKGFAEVMARLAHIEKIEIIPIVEIEPISLNGAMQIRDFLTQKQVKSVIVVAPAFRSRRSLLVYSSVLVPAGVAVRCYPVFGAENVRNWTERSHGIQDVGLQFLKLLYYRFYVLL
jgi:hypothetical protein